MVVSVRMVWRFGGRFFCGVWLFFEVVGVGVVGLFLLSAEGEEGALVKGVEGEKDGEEEE